jgi:mono/diheme cytochrome c family protein
MRKGLLIAAAAVTVGVAAGAESPAGQAPTAAQLEAGRKVYDTQKCRTCHSIAGVGSKVSPLDGVGTRLTEAEIRQWIVDPDPLTAKLKTKPKVKMKKYTLPEPDLNALVQYLFSLKK